MSPPDPDPSTPAHPDDPTTESDPAEGRETDEETDGGSATDGESATVDGEGPVTVEEGPAGREVVVPLALYKRVTVVSTLVAMVSVVAGFVLLDRATNRARLPVSEVDPWLALLGLGLIVAGSVTYAFSTRFRATGMGSSKTDGDGDPDDG